MPDPRRLGLPHEVIVAIPSDGQVLYRLIGRDRPRPADFRSNRDKGRLPARGQSALLHVGVSMFDAEQAARRRARRAPVFIAAVTLEPGRGFYLAKTGGSAHYTVWGDPDELYACARAS